MKMPKASRQSDSRLPSDSQLESPSSPFSFAWSQHVTRHWWSGLYPSNWSNSNRSSLSLSDGGEYSASGQMDREPLTPPSSPASLSGYPGTSDFYNRDAGNGGNGGNPEAERELTYRFKKWKPYKSKKTTFPEYFLK